LFAPFLEEATRLSVPARIRETVEAVPADKGASWDEFVSVSEVAERLEIDVSAASRRVADAVDYGFLVDHRKHERQQARLTRGDPLPEGNSPPLPSPTKVRTEMKRRRIPLGEP